MLKTIELSNIDKQSIKEFIEKFEQFIISLFEIFGINEQFEKSSKVEEYIEEVGYFGFKCIDTDIFFSSANTRYIINHFRRFNGHIGDTEQELTATFTYGTKSAKIYINFYDYPVYLKLETMELTEPENEALEISIHRMIQ
jgi:hypothetical protein